MLPIDEGFHQSQQKTLSSTVSQEEEEKSGAAYKYDILDRLPVELSQCILRHCDFETILVLSLVSRRWHSLCLDRILWRNLYIHHHVGLLLRSIEERENSIKMISPLTIDNCIDNDFYWIKDGHQATKE